MSGMYSRVRQLMTGLNLADERGLYQIVFDTAAAGIVTTGGDGRIESCNPAFCSMFGYSAEELQGKNISVMMTGEHAGKHDAYIRRYLKGHDASVMGKGREVLARRRSGETFLLHLTVSEMRISTGSGRGFMAIVHDLSQRVTGPAQQLDRAWLGHVLDQTPAGLTVKDVNGRYLLLNEQAERMLGVRSGQAVGKTDPDLFPPLWAVMQQRTDEDCVNAASRMSVIPFLTSPHTQDAPRFLCAKSLLRDSGNHPMGIVTLMLDVSALPAMSKVADANTLLLDAMPDPVALMTADGEFLQVNEAYAARFGMSRRSLIGCHVQQLETEAVAAHFPERLVAPMDIATEFDEGGVRFRLQPWTDGARTLFLLTLSRQTNNAHVGGRYPVDDDDGFGDTAGDGLGDQTGIGHDGGIRALEHKVGLLSSLSHELRTPLNAVLGFSQLLKEELHDPEQQEAVGLIEQAGQHLTALVDQILELVKVQNRQLPLHPEAVSLLAVVREAIELVRPDMQQRQITLETRNHMKEPWVMADRLRVKQILLNLLSNAVKYNRTEGHIQIDIQQDERLADSTSMAQGHGRIRVSVSDTGFGIAKARLAQVFEPFNRLGAEQSDVQGTGLGLAICHGLAQRMSGELAVSSVEGEGSSFTLTLPATSPLYSLKPMQRQAAEASSGKGPCKVLYIEDNPASARVVELALRHKTAVSVTVAPTGGEGLSCARSDVPDVILLDMRLPDIHGLDVLQQLRNMPELKHAKIYGVSAEALPAEIEQANASGLDGYMTKPLDLAAVQAWVDAGAAAV
ncbi:PAS domain S-box protein [Thalassolituus sp. LLYu03]|uniref:hybrid sensor histidine kinase/response regulator n=1 Tax=Thalassolituus sp. LLYu03 TaxID=3421656 RepID=UPI003D2E4D2E